MTVDVHEVGMLGKRHHSGNLINGNRPSKGVLQKAAPASDGMVEDDDFVKTVPKMLVPKHEKPKLIDRKKKGEINIGGEYPHKIRTRSSPKSLYEALQKLSTEQKDCVRHMGFGKMLSFTVDGIPGQLGHYVVDNLDTNRMCIKLERGSIDITKEAIHQLVGFPNGGVWMNNIDDKRADKAMSKLWRAHYSRDEGYVSKLNDLMLAMSRYKMEFEMVIKEALGSNSQNSDIINISSKYDDLFSVRPNGNKSNEVRNESMSKGKELMGVDEEPLSQFWTDPTSFDNICKTVDSLVQKHLNSGNGFFDGTCEPSFSLGLTQGDVMCDADFITPTRGEVIFSTRDGRVGVRGLFESLQPNAVVENNVIDCWSIVLNHEEGARSPDSEYRLFIGCSVLISELGVGFSRIEDNRAVAKIKRSIFLTVNGDTSLMNLATYDLVFFPIQLSMHYFLVCFDLKNPTIFVVDSIDMKTKKRLKKAERELDEKHVQDRMRKF
ncbi:putative papain-like cysteine peptidase superfamily [Helianthus debilis subsp. tardiflorus]